MQVKTSNRVSVGLLSHRSELITEYSWMQIAILKSVQVLTDSVIAVDDISTPKQEKQMHNVLQKVLERAASGPTPHK